MPALNPLGLTFEFLQHEQVNHSNILPKMGTHGMLLISLFFWTTASYLKLCGFESEWLMWH